MYVFYFRFAPCVLTAFIALCISYIFTFYLELRKLLLRIRLRFTVKRPREKWNSKFSITASYRSYLISTYPILSVQCLFHLKWINSISYLHWTFQHPHVHAIDICDFSFVALIAFSLSDCTRFCSFQPDIFVFRQIRFSHPSFHGVRGCNVHLTLLCNPSIEFNLHN